MEDNTMNEQERKAYLRGVHDCYAILADLYDTYGDYSEVQDLWHNYIVREKELVKKAKQ